MAVAAGTYHSLAVKSDGTVWAWGYNGHGQLGNGSFTYSGTPVQVSGLGSVRAIAAGYFYSLALRSDGTVWAWGLGSNGQLGNGSSTDSPIPVPVGALRGVRAVTVAARPA